jgi:hypothetical protein
MQTGRASHKTAEAICVMDIRARFWDKVYKHENGCWIWTASHNRGGYGQFYVDGKMLRAHRVAYELVAGPIPIGLDLDHLCRVRNCVNPDHLEPTTRKENVHRGIGPAAMKAKQKYCKNGHLFDEKNTYIRSDGNRGCRSCNLEAVRRYKARKIFA